MEITSLDTIEGRKYLRDIYFELKFKKNYGDFNLLYVLWTICINPNNIKKYSSLDINVSHSQGFFRGTGLWMTEIFSRYYFSILNAFVYFGAAILLLLVGVRKFSAYINDTIVILGFVFEASLLILMFVFLLFSPKDEFDEIEDDDEKTNSEKELIDEIGEIARDMADSTFQLGKINSNLTKLVASENNLVNKIDSFSQNLAKSVAPNDELLNAMHNVAKSLNAFQTQLTLLNDDLQNIKTMNLQASVRQELEKILMNNLKNEEKNSIL
ncbi:MAG TPA: hypothetical protein DCW42_06540 [Bacteroidetes bacterium]|nr:hypothetical protein [Bacteroidota bacterium]